MKAESETATNGCGLCGSRSARELYTARDRLGNSDAQYSIARCSGCGVLRTLPDMSEAELGAFYPDGYWGGPEPSQGWIASSQSEKTQFLSRCRVSGGCILDVGCGSGFFLRALDPEKWDRFGVETSAAASRAAEAALGRGHVFAGTLIESSWEDSRFEAVTYWSALEHMNKPRVNLRETRRIMRKGGTLIVQVPNAASYQARVFEGHWFALDAPRHRYHFTLPVLKRLLSETGFEVYRISYFSKAHNSHALRQSLKTKLATNNASAIGLGLFYVSLPLIKPFDNVMSALGKGATLTVAAHAL